jgi:nitrogen fixation NifU-like protein
MRENIYNYIIDLYKHPHNYGTLKNPTHKSTLANPFCGDIISITLKLKENKIQDIKFKGKGCTISIASASLITDKLKGKSLNYVKKLGSKEIQNLLNLKLSPTRLKCALLPLETIKKALEKC